MPAPENLPRGIRNNNPDFLRLMSNDTDNKSDVIIGYAFVGVIDFLFGLAIGWLIWG